MPALIRARCHPPEPLPDPEWDAPDGSVEGSDAMKFQLRPNGHYKNQAPAGPGSNDRELFLGVTPRLGWGLPVWQLQPSVFGNGQHHLKRKNPLRDKDVTASIEVKS
jgi:hypothetical protein